MITVEPALLGIKDKDIILDAGCGNGRHSWEVYNTHSSVIALDVDMVSIKKNWYVLQSLKQERSINSSYHLLIADVTMLPFKAGRFNRIICSEVLEHIPEDKSAVEELIRVMGKDGTLGISVPHYLAESICWKLSRDYYGFPGGHIRKYRTRDLLALADSTGLSVYAVRHKHALHSFYWIMRCVFGIKKEDAIIPRLYNRLLTWDLRSNHRVFGWLEGLLNHVCPKSVAIYATKRQ